jgi:hypothetical protein
MFTHPIRLLVASAVAVGMLLTAAGAASAVGVGTFTTITTPSGTTTFKLDGAHPSNNHITVSGVTSSDVTTVDVDCILNSVTGPSVQTLSAAVPVTGGSFSTIAALSPMSNCRLRAIPSGVDARNDYIGSYAGPILYMNGAVYSTAGSTTYGFIVLGEQGDGLAAADDAAQCGPALSSTIEPPGMQVIGTSAQDCAFALPSANVTGGGTTATAIKVDGHNAYLPFSVHSFLNNAPQSLGLPQPALAVTLTRSPVGDVTVVESAPLKRCSVDDTYPPTPTSCPSLVNTGVTFTRKLNLFRGDHQIRVRDAFTSSDGDAHPINLQYEGSITPPPSGAVGYRFPGGSSTFHKVALNQVVTGLGTKAGTMFGRSDLDSLDGDPQADTLGLTWSRAPQEVLFSGSNANFFALPYSLRAPANGTAHLGFAYSKRVDTNGAKTLAAIAVNEMVSTPTIGSPSNGAVIAGQTITVKGSVTLGANGLPTNVLVNGHAAHLTKVSATKVTYSVSFKESLGKHTIKVTAKDVAGNTRSASIHVTNVAS